MTKQSSEALRLALNEIDRLRIRCHWMTRFLVAISIAAMCGAHAMVLLRGNIGMGIVFGLESLWAAIFAVGINQGGAGYANTLKILNAIAALPGEKARDGSQG